MNDVNWLTVVTVAILTVSAMLGYINGLIKTVLNVVLGVVTLILVMTFSPKVCDFLQEKTPLPVYIQEKTETIVWEEIQQRQQGSVSLGEEELEELVGDLPFWPGLKDEILKEEWLGQITTQESKAVASYISAVVSEKLVILISYVSTFLVVYVALRILAFLLDIIGRLPLINGINKLTGLFAGLAEGLILVWILGILLTIFGTSSLGQSAMQCMEESKFLSILYGYNLLQKILFWIIL